MNAWCKFRAIWEADVGGTTAAFLRKTTFPRGHYQTDEATVRWSHDTNDTYLNQIAASGGWTLLHLGYVFVRDRGAVVRQLGEDADDQKVLLSFGGDNNWCKGLDVDYAAIAPLRLAWEVERVLWIGQRKGDDEARRQSPLCGITEDVIHLIVEFMQPVLIADSVEGDPSSSPWLVF
ncbi:unnamed protein product [Choristocarpus tenellus]